MGNNAYVSIFIDRRADALLERMFIPRWARKASQTAHGVVFPDAGTIHATHGRQLIEVSELIDPPEDCVTAEDIEVWCARVSGAEAIHVMRMCSYGRGELHMLCTWSGVNDATFGDQIEEFFRVLADRLRMPFRGCYVHEFGVANGRFDTGEDTFERVEEDTAAHEQLDEDMRARLREYHDRARRVPPEWETLSASMRDQEDRSDEDEDDDDDDEDEDEDEDVAVPQHELDELHPFRPTRHRSMNVAEAHALPPLHPRDELRIAPTTLIRMIEQTAYAAPPFTKHWDLGVKLENFGAPGDATNVRMMATDGARLAAAIGEAEPGLPPGRCAIVPREALATIRRLLSEHVASLGGACDSGHVEMLLGATEARVRVGATTVVTPIERSGFPSIDGIVPAALATAVVSRPELLLAFAALGDADGVRIRVVDGQLTLTETAEPARVATLSCASHEGAPIEAIFSCIFLRTPIERMRGDRVTMAFAGESQPFVLRDLPSESSFAIVMSRRA